MWKYQLRYSIIKKYILCICPKRNKWAFLVRIWRYGVKFKNTSDRQVRSIPRKNSGCGNIGEMLLSPKIDQRKEGF